MLMFTLFYYYFFLYKDTNFFYNFMHMTNTRSCFTLGNIKVLKKVFYNFLKILQKKSLWLILLSRDGRLTIKIHIFFFFPAKNLIF